MKCVWNGYASENKRRHGRDTDSIGTKVVVIIDLTTVRVLSLICIYHG